eukprot:tig00021179_g19289.t1
MGWDSSIFARGEFDKAAAEDLVCRACSDIMREPTRCGCSGGHVVCRACVDETSRGGGELSCPVCCEPTTRVKLVLSPQHVQAVNTLKARCDHRSRGCGWTGPLGEREAHAGGCRHAPACASCRTSTCLPCRPVDEIYNAS